MKTTTIETNEAVERITQFANRLRDLFQEAADAGVQLEIPPITTKPEISKRCNLKFKQHRVLCTIPIRYEHRFFNRPDYVTAHAVLGADKDGNPAIVGPKDLAYPNFTGFTGEEVTEEVKDPN